MWTHLAQARVVGGKYRYGSVLVSGADFCPAVQGGSNYAKYGRKKLHAELGSLKGQPPQVHLGGGVAWLKHQPLLPCLAFHCPGCFGGGVISCILPKDGYQQAFLKFHCMLWDRAMRVLDVVRRGCGVQAVIGKDMIIARLAPTDKFASFASQGKIDPKSAAGKKLIGREKLLNARPCAKCQVCICAVDGSPCVPFCRWNSG